MRGWDWKNDRRLHAAIGVAVVVLAAKWLFTGDLLHYVKTFQGEAFVTQWDDEGNVQSVQTPASSAVVAMVIDVAMWVFVAIGSRVLFGSLAIFGAVRQTSVPQSTQSVEAVVDERTQALQWAQQLAIAAGNNDRVAGDELWLKLREYQLRKEIADAVSRNDLVAAVLLLAELTGRKSTKRGSNVQ